MMPFSSSWLRCLKARWQFLTGDSRKAKGRRRSRAGQRKLVVEWLEDRLAPALVINASFDQTFTNEPNAATIEKTINTAISLYEGYIANSITINVTFTENAPPGTPNANWLGNSSFAPMTVPYATYLAALQAQPRDPATTEALASLAASGPNNPVTGGPSIAIQPALATSLGLLPGLTNSGSGAEVVMNNMTADGGIGSVSPKPGKAGFGYPASATIEL